MKDKKCLYCRNEFLPSRYHPEQQVCTSPTCQRRRRKDYHRKKLKEDTAYREQCRDSQSKWLAKNPSYMKTYMARRRANAANKNPQAVVYRLADLLRLEKNNLALNLGAYQARVWVVSRDTESAKNILASAQIMFAQALNSNPTSPSVAKKNIPLRSSHETALYKGCVPGDGATEFQLTEGFIELCARPL